MEATSSVGKRWEASEVATLLMRVSQGLTLAEIALAHGRSPSAVGYKLAQLGKARVDAGESLATVQAALRFTDENYKKVSAPKPARKTVPAALPAAPMTPQEAVYCFNRAYVEFAARISIIPKGDQVAQDRITSTFAYLRQMIDEYEAASRQ